MPGSTQDSVVPLGTVIWICAGLVLIVGYILASYFSLRSKKEVAEAVNREIKAWESKRLEQERRELESQLRSEFNLKQHEWKTMYAAQIRQDAISRSKAVIAGRVAENIAPFLPEFPYNPKDARFLGSPIDFVVFDGLDVGDLQEIVFLEMKTQSAKTTSRQRQIRDAIYAGRVSWQEVRWTSETLNEALPEVEYEDV